MSVLISIIIILGIVLSITLAFYLVERLSYIECKKEYEKMLTQHVLWKEEVESKNHLYEEVNLTVESLNKEVLEYRKKIQHLSISMKSLTEELKRLRNYKIKVETILKSAPIEK